LLGLLVRDGLALLGALGAHLGFLTNLLCILASLHKAFRAPFPPTEEQHCHQHDGSDHDRGPDPPDSGGRLTPRAGDARRGPGLGVDP
jgi:hypothetical protein